MVDEQNRPIVIAHRGASGYLPEHTLPAKALAFGMGADYLEQDVVLTKDDRPLVLHDIHLDTVTDVAAVFPDRHRADGRFYAIDFTLAEIKQLRVFERFDRTTGRPVFQGRFPRAAAEFRLVTLSEEIEFVQGLNRTTRRQVGVYPEVKAPAWHRAQGRDPSQIVLHVLAQYGYHRHDDKVYVQCFDPAELKRIRFELHSDLQLVQLIGENDWRESGADYERMRTREGLDEIASYAAGIGPRIEHVLVKGNGRSEGIAASSLVAWAHSSGLVVHPYTHRIDALPQGVASSRQALELLFKTAHVDGLFTDFPDVVAEYLKGEFGRSK